MTHFPFPLQAKIPVSWRFAAYVKEKVKMQRIDLYCNRCRCKTDYSNQLTGDPNFVLLNKAIVRCHTCRRVLKIPILLEREAVVLADRLGRVFR